MTTFSPHTVGRVATRRSIFLPWALTERRPSCGMRRSAMLMSAMIFSRLMTPDWIALGERMTSCSTPSMRNRTRRSCSVGSRWMSDARSWIAWVISRLTYLTIGASSTISLTLERSSSSSCGVQDAGEVVEVGVGAVVAVDGGGDVGAGGDDRLDVHAGQRPDVVDGEDVGRVGHRDQQLAVLEADRHRGVAAADGARARGRSAEPSTGKSREVDEPQPDLGGQRRDELGLGEHALLDEHPAEGPADPLLLLVGGLELGRADEPALQQDVAQLLHAPSLRRGGCSRPLLTIGSERAVPEAIRPRRAQRREPAACRAPPIERGRARRVRRHGDLGHRR